MPLIVFSSLWAGIMTVTLEGLARGSFLGAVFFSMSVIIMNMVV